MHGAIVSVGSSLADVGNRLQAPLSSFTGADFSVVVDIFGERPRI